MLFLFFYLLSIKISVETYAFTPNQKLGRCAGRNNTISIFIIISLTFFSGQAINYKVSVPSFKQCHDVCVSDQRCCHFSHHSSRNESYPDHSHCFLYSADSCDLTSLVTNEAPSLWRTGRIARCQPQHYNRRQLFGSEFVG